MVRMHGSHSIDGAEDRHKTPSNAASNCRTFEGVQCTTPCKDFIYTNIEALWTSTKLSHIGKTEVCSKFSSC